MIHLDTHVVVWLYAGLLDRIPSPALALLESEVPVISPMVGLELQYLFEVGRVTEPGDTVLADLHRRIGLHLARTSFAAVVGAATHLDWTRDPFDRLIAGQALADNARLLTADQTMRDNLALVCWD